MKIKIINPKDDMQGNQRDNIFIVLDETNNYLGSGYVYPKITAEITPTHPLNIFIDIHIDEAYLNHKIGQMLLMALENRAKELASFWPKKTYLYFGTENKDHILLKFLEKQNYDYKSHTFLMHKEIPKGYFDIETSLAITSDEHVSETYKTELIDRYNDIFITSITEERLHEFEHCEAFRNISLFDQETFIANMILYIEEIDGIKVGKLENIFVAKEYRNKNIGEMLLKISYNYFNSHFVRTVILEVWSANLKAMNFYEKNGFETLKATEFYIGKII